MPGMPNKPARTRTRSKASIRQYSAPALEKGIEILELLAEVPGGLALTEIAARLKRSMNEVFRIVVVMESHGWLSKDAESWPYSATDHLLETALRATPAQPLSAVAAPVMEKLAIDTKQSCHLVVRAGGHGLIIQRQENDSLDGGFSLRVGANVDLVRSCSGHVLLAFAVPHVFEAIVKQLPRPLGWSMARLEKRLSEVRRRGYEMQTSARTAGVTDVGFPVFGFDGRVAAALTVPYLTLLDASAPATLNQTRDLLRRAAQKISAGLGWKGK